MKRNMFDRLFDLECRDLYPISYFMGRESQPLVSMKSDQNDLFTDAFYAALNARYPGTLSPDDVTALNDTVRREWYNYAVKPKYYKWSEWQITPQNYPVNVTAPTAKASAVDTGATYPVTATNINVGNVEIIWNDEAHTSFRLFVSGGSYTYAGKNVTGSTAYGGSISYTGGTQTATLYHWVYPNGNIEIGIDYTYLAGQAVLVGEISYTITSAASYQVGEQPITYAPSTILNLKTYDVNLAFTGGSYTFTDNGEQIDFNNYTWSWSYVVDGTNTDQVTIYANKSGVLSSAVPTGSYVTIGTYSVSVTDPITVNEEPFTGSQSMPRETTVEIKYKEPIKTATLDELEKVAISMIGIHGDNWKALKEIANTYYEKISSGDIVFSDDVSIAHGGKDTSSTTGTTGETQERDLKNSITYGKKSTNTPGAITKDTTINSRTPNTDSSAFINQTKSETEHGYISGSDETVNSGTDNGTDAGTVKNNKSTTGSGTVTYGKTETRRGFTGKDLPDVYLKLWENARLEWLSQMADDIMHAILIYTYAI